MIYMLINNMQIIYTLRDRDKCCCVRDTWKIHMNFCKCDFSADLYLVYILC